MISSVRIEQLTHRRRPFHRAGVGGFTLIEVLFAMLIIVLVVLPMISLISVGLVQRNNGLREYEGTQFANNIRTVIESTLADNLKLAQRGNRIPLFELFNPDAGSVNVQDTGVDADLFRRYSFFNFIDHTHEFGILDSSDNILAIPLNESNDDGFEYRIMMRVSRWEWTNDSNSVVPGDWLPIRPTQVEYAIFVFDPDFEGPTLLDEDWLSDTSNGFGLDPNEVQRYLPYHANYIDDQNFRIRTVSDDDLGSALAFEIVGADPSISEMYYVESETTFETEYGSPGSFALIEESQFNDQTLSEITERLDLVPSSFSQAEADRYLNRVLDQEGPDRAFHVVQFSSSGRIGPIPLSRYASGGTGRTDTVRGQPDFERGAYNLYLVPGFCRAIVTGSISL
ncbi:MAG: type II secretion system protein [Planctomycetota bacterium]